MHQCISIIIISISNACSNGDVAVAVDTEDDTDDDANNLRGVTGISSNFDSDD